MPLIPPVMQGMIIAKAASQMIAGSKLPSLVNAICMGTCQYVLSVGTVQSTNVALGPGAGTQIGTIQGLVPSTMCNLMTMRATVAGLTGCDIAKLYSSVSFGVVMALKAVIVQGSIIGAGPGSGQGKILGLVPNALSGIIMGFEAAQVLSGQKLPAIISAAAFGICMHITINGIVQLTDIGAAAGPPAGPITVPVAPGIGRLM
jgi:hypothetical protein